MVTLVPVDNDPFAAPPGAGGDYLSALIAAKGGNPPVLAGENAPPAAPISPPAPAPSAPGNAPPSAPKLVPVDYDPFAGKSQDTSTPAPPTLMDNIPRALERTGRNAAVGISSLADIYRPITNLYHAGMAYMDASNPDSKDYDYHMVQYNKPTFAEDARAAIDKATDNTLQPRNDFEQGADTGGELLFGLVGPGGIAKTGKALASVPGAVESGAQKLGAKLAGLDAGRISDLENAGLPVNIPAASNSPSVKNLANLSAQLPGGKKLYNTIGNAFDTADANLKNLGFTGNTTPTDAGNVVDSALARWQARGQERFKNVDNALRRMVPDTTPASVDGIDAAIGKITADPGITPSQVEARGAHPAIGILRGLQDDAEANADRSNISSVGTAQNTNTVPFGALKEARTKIGDMITESVLKGQKDAIADRAYGEMTGMMRDNIAQSGGPQAVKAFDLRNKIYSDYMDQQKSLVVNMRKKLGATPEAIYSKMTTGDKVGASMAAKVMQKLNPAERDLMRDAVITQRGGGDAFTISKWANEYGKMSPEAKDTFFMGKPQLRTAHDDLIKGLKQYQDLGKFGNPSRSGYIAALSGIISGSGAGYGISGIPGVAHVLGTAYIANRGVSKILASPKAVEWLAQGLKADTPAKVADSLNSAPAAIKTAPGLSDFIKDQSAELGGNLDGRMADLERQIDALPANSPKRDGLIAQMNELSKRAITRIRR